MTSRPSFVLAALVLLVELAPAQVPPSDVCVDLRKIAELPLGSQSGPRGFDVVDDVVVVSFVSPATLLHVDVSTPSRPTICDSRSWPVTTQSVLRIVDGFAYLGFLGRSPTAVEILPGPCPGGGFGFEATDASTPDVDAAWRGIEGFVASDGRRYVAWSDALHPGTVGGGLVVYASDGLLSAEGVSQGDRDGAALAVTSDGRYAFQLDPGRRLDGSQVPTGLRVWDLADPTQPTLLQPDATPLAPLADTGARFADLALARDDSHAFVAGRLHGLLVVDVTDPAAPTVLPAATRHGLDQPRKAVMDFAFWDDETLLVAVYRDPFAPGTIVELLAYDVSDPADPRYLHRCLPDTGVRGRALEDLAVVDGLLYLLFSDGVTAVGTLEIWEARL